MSAEKQEKKTLTDFFAKSFLLVVPIRCRWSIVPLSAALSTRVMSVAGLFLVSRSVLACSATLAVDLPQVDFFLILDLSLSLERNDEVAKEGERKRRKPTAKAI